MAASSISTAMARPSGLMSVQNLIDQSYLSLQYNPADMKERLEAIWTELAILGQSHQELQYQATRNHQLNFTLSYDTLSRNNTYKRPSAVAARNWLLSTFYASRAATQNVSTGAPPTILLVWPKFFALRCKSATIDIDTWRMDSDGTPSGFKCTLAVKEYRTTRLYMEDVQAQGTIRGGVSSGAPGGG